MDKYLSSLKTYWENTRQESTARLSLIFLRLYLGIFYYATGTNKLLRGNWGLDWQESMVRTVSGALDKPDDAFNQVPGWYAVFLEHVVLEMPTLFTLLVAWGEALLAVALIFGISTRLAGFLGAFMAINFALMSGRAIWLPHFDTTLSVALLTLALARSGRVLGVDQYLAKKWPGKNWLW